RTRRFSAATMPDALRAVKAALGPDAVILDTAEAGGGVTVTVAVDADPPPVDRAATARRGPADTELATELRALMSIVRELVHEQRAQHLPALGPELVRLHRALLVQGVDGVLAAALLRETAERLSPGTALDAALAGALAGDPRGPAAARVRLLLGPPGDGKTTTLAKLAAQARRAGRRVALITPDTYRVGSVAALEGYGRARGAPVGRPSRPAELARALAAAERADVVLIDTPGAGPGQPEELGELAALAAAAGPHAVRTLVASAVTGSCAAERTWRAFAELRPEACVLTKLDVA